MKSIKKKHKKKNIKNKTTQNQNLTAAARDLGTVPSGQIMFDRPQLCPICGPRPVLLRLSTSRPVLGLSTLRTVANTKKKKKNLIAVPPEVLLCFFCTLRIRI
jgi:hypothetical protein